MRQAHRLCLIITIVFTCLGSGCNNTDTVRMAAELETAKHTIRALETENRNLSGAYERLQEQCDTLESSYANLQARNSELSAWARQLAEKFGPSVWYFGKDERPLPHKAIRHATADLLVQELNKLFITSDLPQVELIGVAGQTASVRISDERKLTQQMGTTGATGYIEVVTYTLTSLPDIDSVDFDFKEGDHALPGRYQR